MSRPEKLLLGVAAALAVYSLPDLSDPARYAGSAHLGPAAGVRTSEVVRHSKDLDYRPRCP